MKVLDLFSGIGGFSLGLERAGFETVAFCEIDPKARKVLKKNWPGVKIFEDVKLLKANDLPQGIDLICGGFPCQDISVAGKGEGIEGTRSGLWKEFYRLVKEVKPRLVIIENVANLRSQGLNKVLKDLWKVGYDSQWHCIPASAVGAPHQRDRVWIIAYSNCPEVWIQPGRAERTQGRKTIFFRGSGKNDTYAYGERLSRCIKNSVGFSKLSEKEYTEFSNRVVPSFGEFKNWYSQSLRSCDGIPERLDKNRLSQCGNAVVPQIPEILGAAILEAM